MAQSNAWIVKNFYLTGGTALAAFYYQHRLSEDIDLFCENKEVDPILTEAFLKKNKKKLNLVGWARTQILGLVSYNLNFKSGEKLKVDFNYYPFPRINTGKKFKNLAIDSVYDIAVNKIHTVFMKPRIRDFIDLYFIFKREKDYSLSKLILDAKAKFDWHIDPINLAAQFVRVSELLKTKDLPKILVPFNQKKMEEFFLKLAKSLEREIFV